jgi:hypothetical protein
VSRLFENYDRKKLSPIHIPVYVYTFMDVGSTSLIDNNSQARRYERLKAHTAFVDRVNQLSVM